jgi:DNA transposition AAA+ family ATPase
MSSAGADFVVTKEHRRFAEFCDACRRYRYIGLCYGPPGVGKTLSARAYAQWDLVEASQPVRAVSVMALAALVNSHTVFYTPAVMNTPAQIVRDIDQLRRDLQAIQREQIDREERAHVAAALKQEKDKQDQRFLRKGWPPDRLPPGPRSLGSCYEQVTEDYYLRQKALPDPTTLVVIDEADRFKTTTLEQVRAIFDYGGIGLILIGMPGIEKRLARYPQLYSRVGFVHAFRPLSAAELRDLLRHKWLPSGVTLPEDGIADEEALAAIMRITGGNFRLLHRLITQIARLVEINTLPTVTCQVVNAARESLVIGTA